MKKQKLLKTIHTPYKVVEYYLCCSGFINIYEISEPNKIRIVTTELKNFITTCDDVEILSKIYSE